MSIPRRRPHFNAGGLTSCFPQPPPPPALVMPSSGLGADFSSLEDERLPGNPFTFKM